MAKDLIPFQRSQKILAHLRVHGALSVAQGAQLLATSDATVRRDFIQLCKQHMVERTHGGIVMGKKLLEQGTIPPLSWRETVRSIQKERIAQAAAALLSTGDAVFIDGGTTTAHLVPHLPGGIKVITHSLFFAYAVNNRALSDWTLTIYLAGGQLNPELGLFFGPTTLDTIEEYRPGWAFISSSGVTREMAGNNSERETSVERAMIRNARKKVLLIDSSKMGKETLMEICKLSAFDMLITDREAPKDYIEAFKSAGVECRLV